MKNFMKKEWAEFRLLLSSVPPVTLTLFIISVFSMNLLANKSVALPFDWIALDCGALISWIAFLTMDTLTHHFGARAATRLSVFASLMNLAFCIIFYLASLVPGNWGESYTLQNPELINTALDNTFGGTWYVIFGSTVAFISSSFVNNFTNSAIGKILKRKTGFAIYAIRTYTSTCIGQFCDNFIFSVIVGRSFFGWTLLQCVGAAISCMLIELICEIAFSGFGYRICKSWKKDGIGDKYFKFKKSTTTNQKNMI